MLGATQFGTGYLVRDYGFGPPLWMMNIMFFMAFLYVIIPSVLIETVDRMKKRNENLNDNIKSSLKSGLVELKLLFQNNTHLRRWKLTLLYTIDFIREILEQSGPLIFVYGLGPPFCWSSVILAGYVMVATFGNAIGKIVMR